MPTDDWHYIRGDQQFGPVPFQILQDLARTGDVSAEDLIWCEGMPDWVAAESIQGLLTPQRSPRTRGAGNRPRGARRTGGRPTSRRPGRALGHRTGAPAASTSASAPTARDRAERKRERRTSGMPGAILAAALSDLLVCGLTAFLGFMSLNEAEQYRRLAREQTDQDITNLHWANASVVENAAVVDFIIAGVFAAVALALLSRRGWGPIAQTALSLLAAVPYLIRLAQAPETPPFVGTNQATHQLFILVLVCLVAPICCVWGRSSKDWLSDHASGRRPPGRRRRRGS
ncbi:MAG: hypothetical protein CMJ90_04880 [Planctomycetes bacterium]|nr:hypothetical protein [Planctomycetota bacterium]